MVSFNRQFTPVVVNNHITVQAAAEISGYSLQYLRRLLRCGKLAGLKIGLVESADIRSGTLNQQAGFWQRKCKGCSSPDAGRVRDPTGCVQSRWHVQCHNRSLTGIRSNNPICNRLGLSLSGVMSLAFQLPDQEGQNLLAPVFTSGLSSTGWKPLHLVNFTDFIDNFDKLCINSLWIECRL